MLDLASVSHKLTYVFSSDGTFAGKLKSEVLSKVGSLSAVKSLAENKIVAPYSLSRKEDGKTCILEVIKKFIEILHIEDQTYKKIWEFHLRGTDSKAENALNYFG